MNTLANDLLDVSVLMVEDDAPSRIYCSKILKKLVREVYVAENGLEGLNIFQSNNIDVVVSDIGMPIMDGLEMSREIRNINRNTQIILTTALDNKNYLMQAIEIGINSYIVKPIQKDSLYESVIRAGKLTLLEKEISKQYESIRKLSRAVEQSPSMVLIINSANQIEYVNQKFTTMTKLYFEDVAKKSPIEMFRDNSFVSKYETIFADLTNNFDINTIEQNDKIEFKFPNSSGGYNWLSANFSAIDDGNGNFQNILIILKDVTEEKLAKKALEESKEQLEQRVIERTDELRDTNSQLLAEIEIRRKTEQQLIKAKDEAESANKAKSTFLAKVSHELRTPLNGIIGISSILLTDELSPKQRKFLEMVKFSADGLLDIINDILDFSKIEAGKLQISNSIFSIRTLIENVLELYKQSAMTKKINLFSQIDSNVPEFYNSDAGRIRQVLHNLISNALKFTEQGDVNIKISLDSEDNNFVELLFEVSDTGIGIAENKLAMLFHSFSQVDNSLTRRYGGTGLGLTISKEIIELMGGKIWVESRLGVGSTFYFRLKLEVSTKERFDNIMPKTDHTQSLPSKEDIDTTALPRELKVLIVEDSPINQEVLKQRLLKFKWDISIANNGIEAIESFQNNKFDLIFMDIQMPEMDGLEATELIRKYESDNAYSPVTIIGLTAHVFEEQVIEAKSAGMNECITKPFKLEEILELVSKYLGNNDNNTVDNDPNNTQSSENIQTQSNVDSLYEFIEDIAALEKTLNNNSTVLLKIFDYFIANIRPEYDKLAIAVRAKDSTTMRGIAHKMKSEVGNFNAINTSKICNTLETKGKESDFNDTEALLNELSNHIDLLINAINEYKIKLT